MLDITPREVTLLEAAAAAIESLPDVRVYSQLYKGRAALKGVPDLVLETYIGGQPRTIFIEAKAHGYPRDVRQAISRLRALAPLDTEQGQALMVVAPAITNHARELLREEEVGYWDLSGSLYLKLPGALFYVDRPAPAGEERRASNVYKGRTAQVLHAMLHEPERSWHVQELAEVANVSAYTVHQVMKYLEEQSWVEKEGSGPGTTRVLTKPGALLDAWAQIHTLSEYDFRRFHRWTQSPGQLRDEVTTALSDAGLEYRLTLNSGADLVAPFSTGVQKFYALVPLDSRLDKVVKAAKLREVDDGESVVLLVSQQQAPFMFGQMVDGLWVASNVQLYLDLSASPMRGKEQAEHLRAERLLF